MRRSSRRQLLGTATAVATVAWVPPVWAGRLLATGPRVGPGTFGDGVASGEPTPDAVTFWSRLTTDRPRSGARLVVATDEGLRNVVATVVVPTGAGMGHTLKTRVNGLAPSSVYYYAWQSGDAVSPTGRTRTAPPAGSDQALKIAFSSCQSFVDGYFNGHRHAAAQDLDLVWFLGDYEYEYGEQGFVDERDDLTPSTDLATYRSKLARYRGDAALRELHRLHPTIHMWDDHEVADNYSDNNPSPSALQRAAGYRVSFEWQPRMAMQADRYRIYRTLAYGKQADLILTDERQYRGADNKALLGRAQLDFVKAALKGSTARWKLVGNEVMIAALRAGPTQNAAINPDQWDGYVAERDELLGFIETEKIPNVVFLTGDIHTYMACELNRDFDRLGLGLVPSVATEYVGGSISRSGLPIPEAAVRANNPWIKQFNGADHGYAHLALDATQLVTEYRVSDITTRDAATRTIERFTQLSGQTTFTRESPTAAGMPARGKLSKAARGRRRAASARANALFGR